MGKIGMMGWLGVYALGVTALCVAVWWWMRPEPRTMIIVIAGCAFSVLVAGFLMHNMQSQAQAWERMKREGLRASAKVLQVESTNLLINRRPQVRMRLAVSVPGKPPYEMEHVDIVEWGQSVVPGRELTVYVDRQQPERLVIDWNAPLSSMTVAPGPSPSTTGADVSRRLDELRRLRDRGQISEDEYQAQRQRILSDL